MKKDRKRNGKSRSLQPRNSKRISLKHGLYLDIGTIDGRTRLGKTISALRRQLRDSVGVSTPGNELLIQRIIYKSIRLGLYEGTRLSRFEDKDAAHYLPMANSLRLDLLALAQMKGEKSPWTTSIQDVVARDHTIEALNRMVRWKPELPGTVAPIAGPNEEKD
jgi:hypothetical protein